MNITEQSAIVATNRHLLGAGPGCRTVAIDGVQLAVDDPGGAGIPIVALHAIGHGSGDYRDLRARLSAGYRVIAVDWPGHGRSGIDHNGDVTAERYATLLSGVMRELELESAIIIGNSIGGAAAIRLAATEPDRVRGLVLLNPGGLAPLTGFAKIFCRTMAKFFDAGRRWWFRPLFSLYYRTVLRRSPARERRRLVVRASPEMASTLASAWRGFARDDSDLRELIPEVRCPVFFGWATKDRVVSHRRSRAAIESFADARTELFRAGHSAFLEDPERFEKALRIFLARLDPPKREGCVVRSMPFRPPGLTFVSIC